MKVTDEMMRDYEIELANFKAGIENNRRYLDSILKYVEEYGIENARNHFDNELNRSLSMDAPNKPGYYRANND